MNHLTLLTMVGLLAACGGSSGSDLLTLQQSQVLLSEPPIVCDDNEYGEYFYSIGDKDSQGDYIEHVLFKSKSDVDATAVLEVTGQNLPMFARPWKSSGGTLYLVVGMLDSNEKLSVFRFHDSNSDGLPDASTKTLLFDSGTSVIYVTDIARVPDTGTIYMLDARCADILVATDTDSDGFPDSLSATPFAMSADFDNLTTAACLYVENEGEVDVPPGDLEYIHSGDRGKYLSNGEVTFARYSDTDQDGVADEMTEAEAILPVAPVFVNDPYVGQTSIELEGNPSELVEIWKLDIDMEKDVLLGSGTTDTAGKVIVTVAPALTEDDFIGALYVSASTEMRISKVKDDSPQLVSMDVAAIPYDVATVITLTGVNFVSGMTVTLSTTDETVDHNLSVTIVNSTTATVTTPLLPTSELGTAFIVVSDGAPTDPSVSLLTTSVIDSSLTFDE